MELVLDANILFAALIKSGKTRELLFNDELSLFAPEYLITEFNKHLVLLEEKTGLKEKGLIKLSEELLSSSNVKIIPVEEIKPFCSGPEKGMRYLVKRQKA